MLKEKTPLLFLLIGLLGVGMVMSGCPGNDDDDDSANPSDDDDDDTVGDDDDDAAAGIEETVPQEGDTDFYHRNNIFVEFTDDVGTAEITVVDDGGTAITGDNALNDNSTELTFNPFGDSESDHLTPSTSYTATISWDGQSAELHFQTSDVGTEASDVQTTIVGNDYFLDLGSATFTEPPGVGSLLAQYIADVYVIMHVDAIDEGAGTIDIYGGIVDKEGNDYVQDLCTPTLGMTETEPGQWDNPYMQIGPTDFHIAIEGYDADIIDLRIGGSFTADGSTLVGGTFDGQMDTRVLDELIDPGADEGAACDLLGSLGIECEECPDGSGPFCLTVSAYGIISEKVDVLGYDPETAAEYDTLTYVSEAMIKDWIAGGFCDPA